MADLSASEWSSIVAEGRQTGLLARLAYGAQDLSLQARIPAEAWRHLEAAQRVAEKHRRDVLWEIRCLRQALEGVVAPLVLLKGAAYAMADLPPARGRTFSDIDILVPRAALSEVEQALRAHGWASGGIEPYDDRYYRRWMHQLPPLTHVERGTTVDVHHTIVPMSARAPVDAAALLAGVRVIPEHPALAVLQPVDMVLHSAVHLFNEGQFERALRDLHDIVSLLQAFSGEPGFWRSLVARAEFLGLSRPLWYALDAGRWFFEPQVPAEVLAAVSTSAPPVILRGPMRSTFRIALEPPLVHARSSKHRLALFALYVRAHYLRMPLYRLIPHLVRKAVTGEAQAEAFAVQRH